MCTNICVDVRPWFRGSLQETTRRLTHSRLPYVQFVFSQDKVSFVASVVLMLEYCGGATQFIGLHKNLSRDKDEYNRPEPHDFDRAGGWLWRRDEFPARTPSPNRP